MEFILIFWQIIWIYPNLRERKFGGKPAGLADSRHYNKYLERKFEVGDFNKVGRCPRRYYNFLRWPKVLIPITQILQRKIAVFYQKHFKGHFEKQPASAFRISPLVVGQRTHPSGRSENCTILSNIQSKSGIFFFRLYVAIGNRIARADDSVVIKATDASALPTAAKLRRGPQVGSTPRSASRSAIGSQGLTARSAPRSQRSIPLCVAFGNRLARADDSIVIKATDASALPKTSFGAFGGPGRRKKLSEAPVVGRNSAKGSRLAT